jgi:hypothetical protein
LRKKAPTVQDQNGCSACVGHGTSCAITTAHCVAGKPLFGFDASGAPVPCSPRDPYTGGRCYDRLNDGSPETAKLQDEGTFVLSAIEYVADWGVRKTGAPMQYDGAPVNSDCVPLNVNDEPKFDELEADSVNIQPRAHQIISTGAQRVNEICLALDAGHPVVFGMSVDQTFCDYTGGIVGAMGASVGGHCMCLLGYSTVGGKRIFNGRNSWGADGWGEAGDFRCSEAFIAQIDELFAVTSEAS